MGTIHELPKAYKRVEREQTSLATHALEQKRVVTCLEGAGGGRLVSEVAGHPQSSPRYRVLRAGAVGALAQRRAEPRDAVIAGLPGHQHHGLRSQE